MQDIIITNRKWVRSKDGWISGVIEGLAKGHGFDPNMLRLIWLLSVFVFGSGILVYLFLSFVLPREDRINDYDQKKILGVCVRLAQRTGLELGLVRMLTAGAFIISGGMATLVYLLMFFFVDEKPASRNFFNY